MEQAYYIAKNINEILGIFHDLNDAYQQILDSIYLHLRFMEFNDMKIRCSDIHRIINSSEILCYKQQFLQNNYSLVVKNNFIALCDSNQDVTHLNTIKMGINIRTRYIMDYLNKDADNNESSEINLFIPMKETPVYSNSNNTFKHHSPVNDNNVSIEQLKERINLLTMLKNYETAKLEELNKEYMDKEDHYIKEKMKVDKIKLQMRQEQEKWDLINKKFEADKKLYFIFKREIESGLRDRSNIPELFCDTYPIFEKLENGNHFNTPHEIKMYVEFTKNKEKETSYDDNCARNNGVIGDEDLINNQSIKEFNFY